MSLHLPAVLPVTPSGQAILPVPVRREPNHVAKDGSILRDPFDELLAANRAGQLLGDWGPLIRMVEGAR